MSQSYRKSNNVVTGNVAMHGYTFSVQSKTKTIVFVGIWSGQVYILFQTLTSIMQIYSAILKGNVSFEVSCYGIPFSKVAILSRLSPSSKI